jgi:hypothetical protein
MILTKEMLLSHEPHPEYYTARKDLEVAGKLAANASDEEEKVVAR